MVFWGIALPSLAQEDADVVWYENLFRPKKIVIEKQVAQANTKRQEAIDSKDKSAETKALIELGVLHLVRVADYEQAMGWLIRSLAIEDSLGMRKEKIFTCLAIARVFENVGDNYKSLEFLGQAQRLSDQEKNKYIQTLILNESGRVEAVHDMD